MAMNARPVFRALLLLASSAPLLAAQPTLDEVLVTSTRIEQRLFDVPAAVDSVNVADRPDALGAGIGEFLGAIPGLMVRDRLTYVHEPQMSVRGFGARAQFGIVGLKLYVDDIPGASPDGQGQLSHVNLDSVEHIEVLRGPYSALYGNSAGGVVQIYTQPGSGPASLKVGAVGGSYDTWRSSLGVLGETAGLGYNASYTHLRTDGARQHSAGYRDLGNLRLDYAPWDGNRLTLVANRLSTPGARDAGGLTLAQFAADPTQAAASSLQFDTRKSMNQTQFGLRDEQRIGAHQSLRVVVYGGTRKVLQVLANSIASQASPLAAGGVVDLDNRYQGADVRWTLASVLAGRPLTVVGGASWDRSTSRRHGWQNYVGTTTGVIGALRRDENNVIYNFDQFLQASWDVTDRYSALLGLRHGSVNFDSTDYYITARNPDDSGGVRYEAWTPAATVSFKAQEDLNLYASIGRGLDTPTFDQLSYRFDGGSGPNFNLKAARTASGEIGAKWRYQHRLYTRLSVFRASTDDEIAVQSAAGGRSTYHNAGRAIREGVELEFDATLNDWLHAQASYTLLDARYADSFRTCTASPCAIGSGPIVPAGKRIPGAPGSNAYALLRFGGAQGWNASLEASYLDKVPANDFNREYAPAYTLVGASAGYLWQSARWSLRGFVRVDNLFDRQYVSAVVINDNFGRYYLPGSGRAAYAGFTLTAAAR